MKVTLDKKNTGRLHADPADDPEPPEEIVRVDPTAFFEEIDRSVEREDFHWAQMTAMRYAIAVVKAHGLMEPLESEARDHGYRFRQVTKNNWVEIVEEQGYPVPELPSALTIEVGSGSIVRRRENVKPFVIHDDISEVTDDKLEELERRRRELLPPR